MRGIGLTTDFFLSYLENTINYIGHLIVNEYHKHSNVVKVEDVAEILENMRYGLDEAHRGILAEAMFDFVTPDGSIVASTVDGAIKHPKNIKEACRKERAYMTLGVEFPWKMHVCTPDISTIANELIIPVGFGITDENGKFLGYVTSGINVQKFKEKITSDIGGENYTFMVLNENLDCMLYSEDENRIEKDDKAQIKQELTYLKGKKDRFGALKEALYIDGVRYIFYSKAKQYPFIIIIGVRVQDKFDTSYLDDISGLLDNIFSSIEQHSGIISKRISLVNNVTSKKIGDILKSVQPEIQRISKDLVGVEFFDFVDDKGRVIADIEHGELDGKMVVEKDRRCWMNLAQEYPSKLHICQPDMEISENPKHFILPCGYGVNNVNGKFLGIISGGIVVDKLKSNLKEVIPTNNHTFILFDSKLNYILCSESEGSISEDDIKEIQRDLQYLESTTEKSGTLPEELEIRGSKYMFYSKSQKYPFIVLVGMKNQQVFNAKLLERKIAEFRDNGKYDQMFLLSLLYLFQKKIVSPAISGKKQNGNDKFTIPKIFSDNINDLFIMLEQIEGFMDIKSQNETNAKVAEERKSLMEQRESFFQAIAHDMGNPLASIKGFLELAEMDGGKLKPQYIEMMRQACDNAKSLVDNILIVAKMQSGTLELKRKDFSLIGLIEDVIEANRYNIECKGLYIRSEVSDEITAEDDNYFGDKQMMNRVITNLVTNSTKFTREGGITISLYKNKMDEIVISVADTGQGIEEKDQDAVFEEFRQTEVGKKADGTGIGLPIVKKFVEMHGGKIELESQVGQGTQVKITL